MSENETEKQSGITDDQLPPDLVPGEDNPLAEALPDGEGSEVLEGGKVADEMTESDDAAAREGHQEAAAEEKAGPAGEHD